MMEIDDEITILAPRAKVYAALNDIAILKACIPGCESLERESDIKLVAKVTLTEDGETTILRYKAKAETGGKIAQLGGRLITSTAKKLSKNFFDKFEKIMTSELEV